MQEKAEVLLVSNTRKTDQDYGKEEILFLSSEKWVINTLKGVGLTNSFHDDSDKEDVLVLAGDTPLISEGDIIKSYAEWQKTDQDYMVFADSNGEFYGSGWIKKAALLEILPFKPAGFTLEDLKGKCGAQAKYTAEYNMHIQPVDSSFNRHIISKMAKEMVIWRHLENGVDIPIGDGVVISPEVEIEAGSTILSGTTLSGKTKIGTGCTIGPNSVVEDGIIGDNVSFVSSHMEKAEIGSDTNVGPMARIRPNSVVGNGVKIGNFVEVKNSNIGDKTSISHLTYVGDSDVGRGCNLGCGVVTVNYDGKNKFRTTVGDNAFVGCNSNLVSPVTIGDGAYIAAGTTVTEDVVGGALAIGRVRQTVKENWAENKQLTKNI